MKNYQGRNRASIDGFVPSNQGRHVGFGAISAGRATTIGSGTAPARMRRPALHQAPAGSGFGAGIGHGSPMIGRPSSPTRTGTRQSLPDFTTYNATRSTGQLNSQAGNRAAPRDDSQGSGSGAAGSSGPKGDRRKRFGRKSRGQNDGGRRRGGRSGRGGESKRQGGWKKVVKRTVLALGLIILVTGGWLGWRLVRTTSKVFGDDSSVLGFLNSSKLNGEDQGRVNILLAGVSTDDPGHEGADLTDSVMLASIDTTNHTAVLLSIPRDLWVNIPGYGYNKINAANAYGDGITGGSTFNQSGYPGGGMGLLEKVVAGNLGLPIHYYAKINYTAFKDAVNAVGGITVNIQSEDKRGLYDPNINKQDGGPLKLPNGSQKLDGQTALNLARARGDPTGDGRVAYGFPRSDFDRTEHQRMMLLALKEKISSGSVITNPLKISQLFDTVAKNMKTDLKPSEVRRLYDLGKQVQGSSISSLSLNDADGINLLASYRAANGASALVPAAGIDDYSAIKAYLRKMMTNDPVAKESAKVVVLNGGDTTGLATKYQTYLTDQGFTIVAVDDAPHTAGASLVIDQTTKKADGSSGKPATKAKLLKQLSATASTTAPTGSGYPTADFIVILGTNQKAPASSSSSSNSSSP